MTPANENPWYVLMTLYGEQTGEFVDRALHERNRAAWNAWSCQAMTQEEREKAAKAARVSVDELSAWPKLSDEIRRRHKAELMRRVGEGYEYLGLPEVTEKIELSEVLFEHSLEVTSAVFGGDAVFFSARFDRDAFFTSATFMGKALFDFSRFGKDVRFRSATFIRDADFRATAFAGNVDFGSATFKGDAEFSSSIFSTTAWFVSVVFGGALEFVGATFEGPAWFKHSTAIGDADFSGSSFIGLAEFGTFTFGREADFFRTKFKMDAWFDQTKFKVYSGFSFATFGGFADFQSAEFGENSGDQAVDFKHCIFSKPMTFHNATFHSRYPNFSGAILHEKTTFTAKPEFWPQGAQPDPEQAKASCAVIRHSLGKQGLPEEEHFFFRREMGFAAQIGGWWQQLPYRAFGLVSDFGYSIQRPALWMLGLFVGVAMINHVVLQWGATLRGEAYHPMQAFALSFANQFPLFGLHARWFSLDYLRDLNPWLKALGGVQTVASLPLLFFLGLGLRTRFRMR